jgi:hypothetical protein
MDHFISLSHDAYQLNTDLKKHAIPSEAIDATVKSVTAETTAGAI